MKTRSAYLIAGLLLAFAGATSLGLYHTGEQMLTERTEELRSASMEQAVTVRANGAALAFAQALQEDWERLVWTAETFGTAPAATVQQALDTLALDARRISWAGLAGLDGRVRVASNTHLQGANVAQRPWFTAGLQGPYAGDVHDAVLLNDLLGGTREEPLRFLDFALPVRDAQGSVTGVMAVHISADWATGHLTNIARSLGIDLFIVAADGTAVLRTDGQKQGPLFLPILNVAGSGVQPVQIDRWPDGQDYFTTVVPTVKGTGMPDFGWRMVARISPASFGTLASGIPGEMGTIMSREGAAVTLRSLLAALSLAAVGLTGLVLYFRLRFSRASDRADDASARLASSEQRFGAVVTGSTLPIALIRGDRITFVNEAAARMLGHDDPAGMRGLSFLDISPERQADGRPSREHLAGVEAALAADGTARFDWSHVTRDGRTILLDVLLTVVPATDPREIVAILADVTSERRAEEILKDYQHTLERAVASRTDELDQRNNEQQAVFDAAPFGIALVRGGRIVQSNRHLGRQFGLSEDALRGRPLAGLFRDPRTAALWLTEAEQRLRAGTHLEFSEPLTRADGSTFWGRVNAVALDPDDPARGEVWVIDDVTDEQEAAQALRQAKDLADQTARLKSDFLSTMSHEIRTPLNSMIGFLELAADGSLNEQKRPFVTKAIQSGQHLVHIVNDVLDLSRAESGKLVIESVEFDLVDLAHGTLESISPVVAPKGVEPILDLAPDLPRRIKGDPLRLRQILNNYLSNAAKFTATGEIVLSVRRIAAEGRDRLRFCVIDTGLGLTEAQAKRLFESFAQADQSTARLYGGSGLGLAICRQLADLMGGAVGVASEPGKGSTFWLDLDLVPADDAQPMAQPLGAGRHVLLGVVNARLAETLSAALTASGFVVERAEATPAPPPGTLAILGDRFMARHPNVVAALAGHPVIRLLGMARAHEAGENRFSRPVDPFALAARAAQVLNGEPVPAPPPPPPAAPAPGPGIAGLRVLVADDDAMNRELATARLARLGIDVHAVTNGAEAVQAVLGEPFDMIFMDHQMPVLDGIEATRRIRALGGVRGSVPIVAVTGTDRADARAALMEAGTNDLLMKPLSGQKLVATLTRHFPERMVPGGK